jgi:hypothetical protein
MGVMKKETQIFFVSFFTLGGLFAALMAIWDYAENKEFSLGRFLFFFFSYGLLMGIAVYSQRKGLKKDSNNDGAKRNESE